VTPAGHPGAAPPAPAPAEWQGILDPGEQILWQGRPDGRVVLGLDTLLTGVFGLAFAGFALVWMVLAAQAGGFFWAFGLIHFAVGLGLAVGAPLWSAFRRRRTWYTLSDRRAFIATDLPLAGCRLEQVPITPATPVTLVDADPPTIHLAQRPGRRGRPAPVGFERIAEGRAVLALIRQVQRAADDRA
jgi:hypothetical protein